jgi:hypothetical protein
LFRREEEEDDDNTTFPIVGDVCFLADLAHALIVALYATIFA